MPEYHCDRRDIEFLFYEHLGIEALSAYSCYEDFGREIYDHVLTEAVKLAKEVIWPANLAGDRESCRRAEDGQVEVPEGYKEAYRRFCAGDWVAVSGSPEHGGQGLPHVLGAAVTEIIGGAGPAFSMYPGLSLAAGNLLVACGTDWMRETVVPKLFSGEWQGTMALTEPQAGSAVGDLTTKAFPEDDGRYRIEGNKIFISCAEHGMVENFAHLVLARIPGDPGGTKGISIFLVPKRRFDPKTGELGEDNHVRCTGIEHKMGINGSATCALSFGEDGPCYGWIVGEPRQGLRIMFRMMNEARIGTGLQGHSIAAVAYEMARAFAKERVQGTHPDQWDAEEPERIRIIKHPDVRRMLLDMKATVEATRALLYYCAFQTDIAHGHPDEETRKRANYRAELLTPICKAFSTDQAFLVTATAIQVHGGYGYCSEYGVEQSCRDSKISSIYEGTNGIQALDLLGRKMAMKGGRVFMGYVEELNRFLEKKPDDDPELASAFDALGKARGRLLEVAMKFMTMGQGGDRLYPILSATPFLELFGYVICAQLLLEQAVIAHPKLEALQEEHGVETAEERHQLCRDNAEVRFYEGKLAVAKYWAAWKLPRVHAIAKGILSEDRSPLATIF